jgi:hypothetical protein
MRHADSLTHGNSELAGKDQRIGPARFLSAHKKGLDPPISPAYARPGMDGVIQ